MRKPANKLVDSRLAAFLIAAVTVFALSQIIASAHAAHFGDEPHEHNGQVCVLSLVAPGSDKLTASGVFALTVSFAIWAVSANSAQSERARLVVRAARPRGPPNR